MWYTIYRIQTHYKSVIDLLACICAPHNCKRRKEPRWSCKYRQNCYFFMFSHVAFSIMCKTLHKHIHTLMTTITLRIIRFSSFFRACALVDNIFFLWEFLYFLWMEKLLIIPLCWFLLCKINADWSNEFGRWKKRKKYYLHINVCVELCVGSHISRHP